MKLAFSTNAFTGHTLQHALSAVAAEGYGGVEILADKPHWYPAAFDPAEAAAIRRQLDTLHLAVSNINANCTFGYWKDAPPEPFFEPSLISPSSILRADRIRMIQNTLQFAKAVGADNISITSGKALSTMPPDAAIRRLRESLRAVLDTAEKWQIRVGIECEPLLFIEWATELRALIDDMNSPLLGANLDLGHSLCLGEELPATINLLQGRIWNCHIEDLPAAPATPPGTPPHPPKHYHLIPGTGCVHWPQLRTALEAIRYDRFLTVELYTCSDRPAEAARESMAFLGPLFK